MEELQARLLEYAQLGDVGGVEATLRGGAGLDAPGMGTHPGRCAIHHAAAAGHVDVVRLLVSWGADTNLISGFDGDYGGRPGHLAAEAGFSRSLIEMIHGGANINLWDANGYLPLHRATIFSRWRVLKVLQSLGYDLEARTFKWETPLHLAASLGDLWTVKWLVESGGVRVDLTDQIGYTALNQPSVQYHKEVFDYLAAVHYQMWDDNQSQGPLERQYHQSHGHFQHYTDEHYNDCQQGRQSRVYRRGSYRPKPYRASSNRTQATSKKETTGEALAIEASSTGASLTCPINNEAPEETAEGHVQSLDTSTGLAHQVSHSDSASQTDLTMIPQTEQIEQQHNIQMEDTQPNAKSLITDEHSKSNKSLTGFTVRPSASLNCPVVDVGAEKKVHTNGQESDDVLEVWERAIPQLCDTNHWNRRERDMEKTEVPNQCLDKVREVNVDITEPQTLKQITEHEVNGEVLLDSEKPEMKRTGPDSANSQTEPKINGGTEKDLNGVAGPECEHKDKQTNGLATDQTQGESINAGGKKEEVRTQEGKSKAKKNTGKVNNYSQSRKKRSVVNSNNNNKTEEAQHNGILSKDISLLEEQMSKLKIGEHDIPKDKLSCVENTATNTQHQYISKTPIRLEGKEVVTIGKEFEAKSMHHKTRKSSAELLLKGVEVTNKENEVETDVVVKASEQLPESITLNGTTEDHKEGKAREPTRNICEPSADKALENEEGNVIKFTSEDTVKELEKQDNNIEENDQKERVGNTEDKHVIEVTCTANLDEKKTMQVTEEMKNEGSVKNESTSIHSLTLTQEKVREEAEGKYLEHDNIDKLHAQRETPNNTNSVPLTRAEREVNGTGRDGEENKGTTISKAGKPKRDRCRKNVKYTQVTPLPTTNTEVNDGCQKEQERLTKDAQEDKPALPDLEIQNNPEILPTKKGASAELSGHDKPRDSSQEKTTNKKNEKSKKKSKNSNEGQNRKSKRSYDENKEKEQVLNGNDINQETVETTIKTTLPAQEKLKGEDFLEVQQREKSIAKVHKEKAEEKLKEEESIAEVNCVKEKTEDKVMEKAEERVKGKKPLAENKEQDTNKESPLEGDDAQDIKHSTPSSKTQAVEDVNKHTKESNVDESKAKTEVAEDSQHDKDSQGQPLEEIEFNAKSQEEPNTKIQLEPVTESQIEKPMTESQVQKSESQIEKPMPKSQKENPKTELPVEKHETELKTEPKTVLQTKAQKMKVKESETVEETKIELQQEPKADLQEEEPQVEPKTEPQVKEKVNHKAEKLQEDKTSEDTKEPGFTNNKNSHSKLKPKDDLEEYTSYSGKKKKKSKKGRGIQKEINGENKSAPVKADEDVSQELLGDDLMESLSNGEDGMTAAEDHDVEEECKTCESEEAVERRESEEESETKASHVCLEIKSILKEPKDAVLQEKDTLNDYRGKGKTEEQVTKERLKCVDLTKKVSFLDPTKQTTPKTPQEESRGKHSKEETNIDDIAETPSGIDDIAEATNENESRRKSTKDTVNAKATPANLSKTKKRERRKKHKQHLESQRIHSSFSEEIAKIKENLKEKTMTRENVKEEKKKSSENGIEKSQNKATSPKMPRKANTKETETIPSKKGKGKRAKATKAESDKQESKINDAAKEEQMAEELESQEKLEGQAKGNMKKEVKQGKKNVEKPNKNRKKMNENRKIQTAEHKLEPDADSSSTNLVDHNNLLNDAGPMLLTERETAEHVDTKTVSPKVANKELSKKDQGPELVVEDTTPEIGINIREEKIKADTESKHCQAEGKVSEMDVKDLEEEVNYSELEVEANDPKEVEDAEEEVKVPEENVKDPVKKVNEKVHIEEEEVKDPEDVKGHVKEVNEKVHIEEEEVKDPGDVKAHVKEVNEEVHIDEEEIKDSEDVKGHVKEANEEVKGPEDVKGHVEEFKDPEEEVKDPEEVQVFEEEINNSKKKIKDPIEEVKDHKHPEIKWEDSKRKDKSEETKYGGSDEEIEVHDIKLKDHETEAKKPQVEEKGIEDTKKPIVEEEEMEDTKKPKVEEKEMEDIKKPKVEEEETEDTEKPKVEEEVMEDTKKPIMEEQEIEDTKKPKDEEEEAEDTEKPKVEEEITEDTKKPKEEKRNMEDTKKPTLEKEMGDTEKPKEEEEETEDTKKTTVEEEETDQEVEDEEDEEDKTKLLQECDLSYMTSVVQCLGHLPVFTDLLTPYPHRSENESSCEITEAVTQAMKELAVGVHTTTTTAALHHLKAVVEAQESIIQGLTRGHPFTFLCDLLVWLHQELSQTNTTDQNSSSSRFGGQSSAISRVFHFLKETRFVCERYGLSLSRTRMQVSAIQVRVDVHNTLCLQSLLLKPPRPETVEWQCPACKASHPCRRQKYFASLPHILIIRLIRGSRDHQEKPSPFLCEHLDLQDLLLPCGQSSGKYQLEGVISEKDRGSDSVEFTAYCRRHNPSSTTPHSQSSTTPPPSPHSLPHHHNLSAPTAPPPHSFPQHHNLTPTPPPAPAFCPQSPPPHSSTWKQHIGLLEREIDTNTVLADDGATILFFVVQD